MQNRNIMILHCICFVLLILGLPIKLVVASPYHLSFTQEFSYLGIGSSMLFLSYTTERNRKPPNKSDLLLLNQRDIPVFDRVFANNWNINIQRTSDVLLLMSLASPLSLLSIKTSDYATIGILYAETLALTAGATGLAKSSITRYRPYAYGNNAPLDKQLDIDAKRSFFSGHAALASSGLIFTATVFSDYRPESKYKKHVWAGAVFGSLIVSGLRVAGGAHFPSDVVMGTIVGSLIGYMVPMTHRKNSAFTLLPFINNHSSGIYLSSVIE